MIRILQVSVLISVTLSLSACLTTQPLSVENKKTIKNVRVDREVTVPSEMYYMGPGFAFVGPLVSGLASIKPAHQIQATATNNHIQIDKIVRDQLIKEITHTTKLNIVENSNEKVDADLQIKIINYGFTIPQGFSFQVAPILIVDASLLKDKNIIWHKRSYELPKMFGGDNYTSDQLIQNPKLIAACWQGASEEVAKNLVKDLA